MVPKLLQLRSCCEAIENVAKTFWHSPEVARMFDAVAMLLRNCREAGCEALAMPSRSRHEAVTMPLQGCCEMVPKLLWCCCEAVARPLKMVRNRCGAITRLRNCFDAIAMLLKPLQRLLECWVRSREACSEAVLMRRCSVAHAKQ